MDIRIRKTPLSDTKGRNKIWFNRARLVEVLLRKLDAGIDYNRHKGALVHKRVQ